ncbi:hypothetical protein [Alicyclobacillus acidiphilus]|uniref:hypothetical protein n=1 Tax=Alicyclobacillus acidiphilus TaxID=182455 RepID=UPI0012EDEFF9|nr:hypothetical protein [Alicyclobacillus acidiphilus]
MKHTMLFFHLFGLAIWFGSLIAVVICVLSLRNPSISAEAKQILNKFQLRFTIIGNVGAFMLLISGFVLFTMSGHHEIWVDLMAGIGGGMCVFSLIALTAQSNLLSGRVRKNNFDRLLTSQIGLLNFSSWFVMVGIVIVLLLVSYKP